MLEHCLLSKQTEDDSEKSIVRSQNRRQDGSAASAGPYSRRARLSLRTDGRMAQRWTIARSQDRGRTGLQWRASVPFRGCGGM